MKYTIITICYNASATIERTLRSVTGQTWTDKEYIIVDGASKDSTLEIISRYRDNIDILVSEPDKGLYDAMNKGLKLATGDYVLFMNAGDRFHEDTTLEQIAAQVQKLDKLPGVIYGNTALTNMAGEIYGMRRLNPPEHLDWKSFKNGMLVCHQAFYARRDIAEPYDLRYRFSADVDWCIRVMKKADTLHNTHLIVADYLEDGSGVTIDNRKASLKERFAIMRRHYGLPSTLLHHAWFAVRLLFK
ncbi:MAG: glycosyltransferase [Bacteroidales bacterium]|nr:glycosyltransferase [Bacteroidales bacterium]